MRRINFKNGFLTYATLISLLYALFSIVSIFLSVYFQGSSYDTFSIISLAINVVFYCFIGFYFYRAKNSGNYGFALYAMLALAISTYLIPLIMFVIQNILALPFVIASLLTSLGIGVAYSIVLILESRKHKKGLIIALEVLGVILAIIGLISFIFSLINIIDAFIVAINTGIIENIIISIFNLLSSIISLGFPIIFGIFPFYLSYERKYN